MFWFVVGYVRVKLSGSNISAVINDCRKNDIELKNIRRLSGMIYCDIKCSDLKRFYDILKKRGVSIGITGRFGLAMKIFLYRSRYAFFSAAIFFLIILALNSLFISDIKISGNKRLADSQILSLLADAGVEKGTFSKSIDKLNVQNDVLKNCGSLSWIWIDIKGTVVFADVRETVQTPEIYDFGKYCDIKASRDGYVTEIITETGIPTINSGVNVKKGDILVSGVYDESEDMPVRYVRARARVYAKTKYSLESDFSGTKTEYKLSEKNKSGWRLSVFNLCFEDSFDSKNCITQIYPAKKTKIFGKFYLPWTFTKKKYCEIISKEYQMSKKDAEAYAADELTKKLRLSLNDGATIISCEKTVTDIGNGRFHMKIDFECMEDIAVESPLNTYE